MGKKHLIAVEAEGSQRSLWGEAWRRFKKNRMAMIGMYFILTLVFIAIATIIIDAVTGKSIYLNYVVKQNLRGRLQGPSLAHPFGLDEFGRDMLLRMLWAVRYSLFMGTVAIIISCIFGGLLGAFAGYYGKTADNIIMRIMD
ncbi:ABC transporter permease, partial [Enterocloster lavalensis]